MLTKAYLARVKSTLVNVEQASSASGKVLSTKSGPDLAQFWGASDRCWPVRANQHSHVLRAPSFGTMTNRHWHYHHVCAIGFAAIPLRTKTGKGHTSQHRNVPMCREVRSTTKSTKSNPQGALRIQFMRWLANGLHAGEPAKRRMQEHPRGESAPPAARSGDSRFRPTARAGAQWRPWAPPGDHTKSRLGASRALLWAPLCRCAAPRSGAAETRKGPPTAAEPAALRKIVVRAPPFVHFARHTPMGTRPQPDHWPQRIPDPHVSPPTQR